MAASTFHVEVIADRTGEWVGNQMVYETYDKAKEAALDLAYRWTSVKKARVVGRRDGETISEMEVFG